MQSCRPATSLATAKSHSHRRQTVAFDRPQQKQAPSLFVNRSGTISRRGLLLDKKTQCRRMAWRTGKWCRLEICRLQQFGKKTRLTAANATIAHFKTYVRPQTRACYRSIPTVDRHGMTAEVHTKGLSFGGGHGGLERIEASVAHRRFAFLRIEQH